MPTTQQMPDSARAVQYPKEDLITGTSATFKAALGYAFDMGHRDAMCGWPEQPGAQITARLATHWRKGHERALKAAYTAGRFCADTEEN